MRTEQNTVFIVMKFQAIFLKIDAGLYTQNCNI